MTIDDLLECEWCADLMKCCCRFVCVCVRTVLFLINVLIGTDDERRFSNTYTYIRIYGRILSIKWFYCFRYHNYSFGRMNALHPPANIQTLSLRNVSYSCHRNTLLVSEILISFVLIHVWGCGVAARRRSKMEWYTYICIRFIR